MEKLVMEKCCCRAGCKLRRCAITLSILNLVFGVIVAVLVVSGLMPWVEDKVEKGYEDSFQVEVPDKDRLLLIGLRTICLYTDIILVILNIPLLVGILKDKKELLLPWLVIFGSQLVGASYFCFVFICDYPVCMPVTWLLIVPLWTYEYLVIHSYYYHLSKQG